jgi:hypothetical protein
MKTRMSKGGEGGLKNKEIRDIVGEESPVEEDIDSDGNIISPVNKPL